MCRINYAYLEQVLSCLFPILGILGERCSQFHRTTARRRFQKENEECAGVLYRNFFP